MKKSILKFMICSLLVISWSAAAAELTTVFLMNDRDDFSCELVETGNRQLDNPITIKGRIYKKHGCIVESPIDEFNKRFQFCALGRSSGQEECYVEFTRKAAEGFNVTPSAVFVDDGTGSCRFVCLTK